MGNTLTIAEIADTVGIKNRFTLDKVTIIFDGLPQEWQPGETRYFPRCYADFFIRHSVLKRTQKGQPKVNALVMLGMGKDESDLDATPFLEPHELIERDPETPTMFDSEGRPLRAVIVQVTGVAGVQQEENAVNNRERKDVDTKAKEGREETIEQIADVLTSASEAVIADLPTAAAEIAAGKHGGGPRFKPVAQARE
jgi:hypothetical protein